MNHKQWIRTDLFDVPTADLQNSPIETDYKVIILDQARYFQEAGTSQMQVKHVTSVKNLFPLFFGCLIPEESTDS